MRYVAPSALTRGSPTAIELIFMAAETYRSCREGESPKASAILSKPYAESSGGSSDAESISRSRRSRMALAYSVRFSLWSGARPGFGLTAAARSSSVVNQEVRPSEAARSGRGAPGGGITPAFTFRTTFSQISASPPTRARSSLSSATGTRPFFFRFLAVAGDAVLVEDCELWCLW